MEDSSKSSLNRFETVVRQSNMTRRQLLMWYGQQRHGEHPVYTSPFLWTFDESLDPELFTKAFQWVVDHHDTLRTTIVSESEIPKSTIRPSVKNTLEHVDLSKHSDETETLEDWVEERIKNVVPVMDRFFDSVFIQLKQGCAWYYNEFHLITDGRSKQLVFERTATAYEQLRKGESCQLNEQIPFSEYVEYQEKALQKRSAKRAKKYWDQFIENNQIGSPFSLAADDTSAAYRLRQKLDPATIDAIRALDGENSSNLHLVSILISVLQLLLRQNYKRSVTIAHTLANRPSPRLQEVLGLCLEMAPIATELSADDTFETFRIKTLKGIMEGMRFMQHLPRNQPQQTIFDVIFNYLNPHGESFAGCQTQTQWLHPGYQEHSLEVQLMDFSEGKELELAMDFKQSVFPRSDGRELFNQYLLLLDQVLSNPQVGLASLFSKTVSNQSPVPNSWTQGADLDELPTDLATHFENQAKQTPETIAIVHQETHWTYRELDLHANQISRILHQQGVDQGTPVAICLERSPWLVAAIIGVLKIGAVYLPLNPNDPVRRQQGILKDAHCRHLISSKDMFGELCSTDGLVIFDPTEVQEHEADDSNIERNLNPDDLAYILYTSGSTGKPKGVCIPHKGPLALVQWAATAFGSQNLQGMLFSTSVSFDLSIFEIFAPLTVGGKIILVENALSLDHQALEEVTFINTVPSIMSELVQQDLPFSQARVICLAGEVVSASLAKACHALPTISEVYNLYGPTEDSVYSTVYQIPRMVPDAIPIGRPISGKQAYVLDDRLQPLPPGESGELYLGGVGLAQGYLNQPELTEKSFKLDPNSLHQKNRLYTTGDRARWNEDGQLEFLGRKDQQIKIRGFRVELTEIESYLTQHPSVSNCAVLLTKPHSQVTKLVAFLSSDSVSAEEMKAYLKERLPPYMIPNSFVLMESMPLNANGKIDRSALLSELDKHEKELSLPTSETEVLLSEIWAELFELDQPYRENDFLELGGDSILVTRLRNRIAKKWKIEFPASVFFEHTTLESLASLIDTTVIESH